ncbi:GNAT family N-acetyltransferase [Lewinella sp. 4G2]|uniref:GNAT family N-acetyltransferase n=1 Tax=Lewinella sp. 4G2 TaxID=1803372 RepID=UPI0007B4DED7|nr:GNAT family protein [Lewinella sp. 4G2]OAV43798.1 hypothetical protein A3850_004475 [Lewinella sp. 4G2]
MAEPSTHPILQTERLRLSKPAVKDVPAIIALANNENVSRTTANMPFPYGEEHAVFWLNMANEGFANKTAYIFAIRNGTTEEFLGGIGLHVHAADEKAVIGYWVGEPHWNKGYVTEALGAIICFAFEELGMNKLEAVHLLENPASGKVMIKNGMVQEGVSIADSKRFGKFRDIARYRLLRSEYHLNAGKQKT